MQILQVPHVWEWYRQRGIALDEPPDGTPAIADPGFPYRSRIVFAPYGRTGREGSVAAGLLSALGDRDECLLWIRGWGSWPSEEDWPRFYATRERHGSRRSLEDAPGHLAAGDDAAALEGLLAQVMENGWDAILLPASGGRSAERRVDVSHDGWAEVSSAQPVRVEMPDAGTDPA
jgi:hypothetical protein